MTTASDRLHLNTIAVYFLKLNENLDLYAKVAKIKDIFVQDL